MSEFMIVFPVSGKLVPLSESMPCGVHRFGKNCDKPASLAMIEHIDHSWDDLEWPEGVWLFSPVCDSCLALLADNDLLSEEAQAIIAESASFLDGPAASPLSLGDAAVGPPHLTGGLKKNS